MESGTARHVARDVSLIFAAVALVVAACGTVASGLPPTDVNLVLALLAAVGGTAACLLAVLAARLTAAPRLGWLGVVLSCYSLVAIPTAALGAIHPTPALNTVRALVHCTIVVLLAAALIVPAQPIGRRAAASALGGVVVFATAASLAWMFPVTAQIVTTSTALQFGGGLVWVGLALVIAVLAVRQQTWGVWQVGAGIALLGVAHTGLVGATPFQIDDLGLMFSSVRLVAIALALGGAVHLAREALVRIDDEYAAQEEELRLAGIQLVRAAERDHELRNGLAGLAGATTLLGGDRPDTALLGTVVSAELHRLDDLLTTPAGTRPRAPETDYAVAPVLGGIATLRHSSGMDIHLDMEPGLRALGSSSTLAQVITNLLANADRHAPGSPVHITAKRRDERVLIHVRDFGPGVPPGQEHIVLTSGVRDRRVGGEGLGLHICRELLTAEGGAISIHQPAPGQRPGCTVVLELPAASDVTQAPWAVDPMGVACGAS
ncbi:MAG: sensor histidine kinase [Pseudonocardia sp.]